MDAQIDSYRPNHVDLSKRYEVTPIFNDNSRTVETTSEKQDIRFKLNDMYIAPSAGKDAYVTIRLKSKASAAYASATATTHLAPQDSVALSQFTTVELQIDGNTVEKNTYPGLIHILKSAMETSNGNTSQLVDEGIYGLSTTSDAPGTADSSFGLRATAFTKTTDQYNEYVIPLRKILEFFTQKRTMHLRNAEIIFTRNSWTDNRAIEKGTGGTSSYTYIYVDQMVLGMPTLDPTGELAKNIATAGDQEFVIAEYRRQNWQTAVGGTDTSKPLTTQTPPTNAYIFVNAVAYANHRISTFLANPDIITSAQLQIGDDSYPKKPLYMRGNTNARDAVIGEVYSEFKKLCNSNYCIARNGYATRYGILHLDARPTPEDYTAMKETSTHTLTFTGNGNATTLNLDILWRHSCKVVLDKDGVFKGMDSIRV